MTREVTVTTVLKRLQDFGNIPIEVIENKGLIGKDVHSAIEADIKGEWLPLNEDRRIAYFDSYAKWEGSKSYKYVLTEQRYHDRDIFLSGQVDAVIQPLQNGDDRLMLLDFKTSAKESISTEGMSIWAMQGHMYHHLLKKNGINVCDEIIFLQLRTKKTEDGYIGINPKEYRYKFDKHIIDRCMQEVHAYWEDFDNAKLD